MMSMCLIDRNSMEIKEELDEDSDQSEIQEENKIEKENDLSIDDLSDESPR